MDFAEVPCKTEEERFRRLMKEHGTALLRLCAMYLKDLSLAEDAVSETFLKAYKARDSFREESSEKTWLTSIAVNTCKDYLRTAWFRRVDRRITPDDLKEPAAETRFPDDTVTRQILALPKKHREVILLRFYQEMDIRDIAILLKIPEGTVKSRLSRAKEKLCQTLERWYFDEE